MTTARDTKLIEKAEREIESTMAGEAYDNILKLKSIRKLIEDWRSLLPVGFELQVKAILENNEQKSVAEKRKK